MGRIGITYQDVANAITTLQGQQKNPTVDRIREMLGTGSRTTIANLLRHWKEKHDILPTDDMGMPIELLNLVKNLWRTLQDKAEQTLHKERAAIAAETVELRQVIQAARQENQASKQENHQLEETNTRLTNQLTTTQKTLQNTQSECERFKERLQALTEYSGQQASEQKRLHDLLQHVQKNLEHYQNSSQQLRHEQTTQLEKQRHEYEQKIATLQATLHTAEQQALAAEHSVVTLQAELDKAEKAHQAITKSNQDNQSARDQLKAQYELLNTQHQALQQICDEKTQLAAALEEKWRTEKSSLTSTKEQLQRAEDKIQALRHDYQFLEQEKIRAEVHAKLLSDNQDILAKTG